MEQLIVLTGPVSAAKTETGIALVTRISRQKSPSGERLMNIAHFRPKESQRSEEKIGEVTVSKSGMKVCCTYIDSIDDIELHIDDEIDGIWLDEIHFWEKGESTPVVFEKVQELRKRGKLVIVSGIGADVKCDPICTSFGFLLQTADKIEHLLADCDWCGKLYSASRNVYIGGDMYQQGVKLGGYESFRPACIDCYNEVIDLSSHEKILHLSNNF